MKLLGFLRNIFRPKVTREEVEEIVLQQLADFSISQDEIDKVVRVTLMQLKNLSDEELDFMLGKDMGSQSDVEETVVTRILINLHENNQVSIAFETRNENVHLESVALGTFLSQLCNGQYRAAFEETLQGMNNDFTAQALLSMEDEDKSPAISPLDLFRFPV